SFLPGLAGLLLSVGDAGTRQTQLARLAGADEQQHGVGDAELPQKMALGYLGLAGAKRLEYRQVGASLVANLFEIEAQLGEADPCEGAWRGHARAPFSRVRRGGLPVSGRGPRRASPAARGNRPPPLRAPRRTAPSRPGRAGRRRPLATSGS